MKTIKLKIGENNMFNRINTEKQPTGSGWIVAVKEKNINNFFGPFKSELHASMWIVSHTRKNNKKHVHYTYHPLHQP